jgi:hypothetical protein
MDPGLELESLGCWSPAPEGAEGADALMAFAEGEEEEEGSGLVVVSRSEELLLRELQPVRPIPAVTLVCDFLAGRRCAREVAALSPRVSQLRTPEHEACRAQLVRLRAFLRATALHFWQSYRDEQFFRAQIAAHLLDAVLGIDDSDEHLLIDAP